MGFYDWDTNPANNTSKPGIDWSEGMLPSGVNNSARQMMADLKAFLASPQFTGTAQFVNLNVSGTATITNFAGSFGATVTTGSGVTTGGNTALELGGARAGEGACLIDFHGTQGTDFDGRIIRGSGANGDFNLHNTGTGSFQFSQNNSGDFVWYTNSAEKMRMKASGSVGIGTSTPNRLLDINGEAVTRGTHYFGASQTGNIGSDSNWLYARGAGIAFQNNAATVTFATLTAAGNLTTTGQVRAGTSLQADNGVVYAGTAGTFYLSYNGGNPIVNFNNNKYIQLDNGNNHYNFVVNGGSQMSVGVNGAAIGAGFMGPGTLNALGLYLNGQGVAAIAAQSLGNPGYMVLSNGFRIMWGTGTVGANTSVNVNYPTAFASFSIPVLSGGININNADENYAAVIQGSSSTTGFSVINSYSVGHSFYWIAVGV